jgi:hypothetical protein
MMNIEGAVMPRFDLSDILESRIGVACTFDNVTSTRFARCTRLDADDRGLLLVVRYDDGETEHVRPERVTYVDGKVIP